MNLPPLRTVRDSAPAPAADAGVPPPRARRSVPGLDSAQVPPSVRSFVSELADHGLIDPDAVPGFLARTGDRLPQLTSRDRVGDALAVHGLLTRYQRDRALAAGASVRCSSPNTGS
jgi:hypothetical protein